MDLFTPCITVVRDMSLAVKRYREEMFVRKSDVPTAVKILIPTPEGTTVYIWHMENYDDLKKIGHKDFSHWVTKDSDGANLLVIVNNKTSTWEFFPISLMGST